MHFVSVPLPKEDNTSCLWQSGLLFMKGYTTTTSYSPSLSSPSPKQVGYIQRHRGRNGRLWVERGFKSAHTSISLVHSVKSHVVDFLGPAPVISNGKGKKLLLEGIGSDEHHYWWALSIGWAQCPSHSLPYLPLPSLLIPPPSQWWPAIQWSAQEVTAAAMYYFTHSHK